MALGVVLLMTTKPGLVGSLLVLAVALALGVVFAQPWRRPRASIVCCAESASGQRMEYPDFTLGEIATICAINFDGRRPSHHSVQAVLADGPKPSRTTRQFPTYAEQAD